MSFNLAFERIEKRDRLSDRSETKRTEVTLFRALAETIFFIIKKNVYFKSPVFDLALDCRPDHARSSIYNYRF